MRKVCVLMLGLAIIISGCGSKEKGAVVGPELVTDDASMATSSAQEAVISSDVGTTSGGAFGAPVYSGAPSNSEAAAASYILPPALYNPIPDNEGYYTVNVTDFKIWFPRLWWATTITLKTKVTGADGSDVMADYLTGTTLPLRQRWVDIVQGKGSVNVTTKLEASNDFRSVTSTLQKKVTYCDIPVSLIVKDVGDLNLNVTVTRFKTGWTGNFVIKNTDQYTIPYWVHGETIDYTGSFGHTAHFDLVRDNNPDSLTFGYHTGDGTVYYKNVEKAKVYFNGDGTGYYTLASENYLVQHPFTEKAAK
ncbi:MAG: hypothetical protein ABH873_04755 [Candidatus Firestonebacteria bacterium]